MNVQGVTLQKIKKIIGFFFQLLKGNCLLLFLLFNSKGVEGYENCEKHIKAALDKYLRTIPNKPQIGRYTASCWAESNSC